MAHTHIALAAIIKPLLRQRASARHCAAVRAPLAPQKPLMILQAASAKLHTMAMRQNKNKTKQNKTNVANGGRGMAGGAFRLLARSKK